MTKQFMSELMDKKIKENSEKVVYSFYELRVKYDLSGDELEKFMGLTKIRLENLKYNVFFSDQMYTFKNQQYIVQPNEMIVAIKAEQNN